MYKDKFRRLFWKLCGGQAATAPANRQRLRTVFRLEALEPRCCPSPLTGGGTGVIWEPQPNTPNYNWSYGPNWENGVPPAPGAAAIFDGSYNLPCNVDVNTSNPIVLQNTYKAPITIQNGITIGITGYQDMDIGADNFVLAFAGPNAIANITAGQEVMGNFEWKSGGTALVNGGDLTIGNGANLVQSTGSPIMINSGVVSIGPNTHAGTSTFKLTTGSANIVVNANGQLDFYTPNTPTPLVSNSGNGAQIANNGVTYLVGSGGSQPGSIAAPFANHATLYAETGGSWQFTAPDVTNNDLSMDLGTIVMMDGTSIFCADGYLQSGGTLEIADDQRESLTVGGAGVANFTGGKIVFTAQNSYGELGFSNVVFNGVEIDMRIGGTKLANDIIACTGSVTIKGNSKLVVTAVNPVQKGSGIFWTLIAPANKINGDFNAANITLPANVVETAGALPNSWQCNS